MLITHELPAGWVDTGEANRIQPSHVAGMVHAAELEAADMAAINAAGVGRFAGEVSFFATAAPPAGWLICNGQEVSRVTYAKLFAAIGEMWGAGNGVSTFKVPDLRGEFLRGADLGRGVDAGRVLGSAQADVFKAHNHALSTNGIYGGGGISAGTGGVAKNNASIIEYLGNDVTAAYPISVVMNGAGETRPRNIAMLPCICTGA